MFKAGDICEVVKGPFPLSSWTDPALIGRHVTVLGPDPKHANYYVVNEVRFILHEKVLRPVPPRDDLKLVSWDDIRKESGWSPYGARA